MMSCPRTRVSDQAPFGGVTDWYQSQGYREPGSVSSLSQLSGVLDLVDSSSSFDSDPSEDSLPPVPDLPLVSPFLCSNDSEADSESELAEQRPERHESLAAHDAMVSRWRDRVASRPEAFRRWRSAPLSTPYLPTTSESSLGSSSERLLDSSSPFSRPSRKSLLEVDTADVEAVADVDISNRVVAHTENSVGMGVEITTSDVREDDEEFKAEASAADTREITVDPLAIGDSSESFRGGIPDLEDTVYDIVHYMLEVRIDRITEIETTQR
ncbi:hypothetical protein Tco_0281051 [Tanacetum coccineum]